VMVVGVALTSLPAAALMRRRGRRNGFLIGALIGIGGSLLAAAGLWRSSFVLFTAGHLLLGIYQGCANYYRFAAAEVAPAGQASRAISWVVAGGLVAAFLGPHLGHWGRDWFVDGTPFVGSYLAQGLLSLLALILLTALRTPPVAVKSAARQPLSLRQLVANPLLPTAVFGAAIGYATMSMVMTATPLAMLGCGMVTRDVAPVIQWHVVGMFAPSLFTGNLLQRFGALRIMQAGFLLLLGHVAIALTGVEFLNFLSALILLGLGWNFTFVGGTALLTQAAPPAAQLQVQAINEFLIFGLVAIASLSAGWLYHRFGWQTLNLAVLPTLLLALAVSVLMARRVNPAVA